jgi:CBS domain-containing protein
METKNNKTSIKKLMTKNVITVSPDTPLTCAAEILIKKNFNGLPVVDSRGRLIGMLTEYDLMIRGSSIHLPTFLKLLDDFDIYRKDKKFLSDNVKKILAMKVRDAMEDKPLTLNASAAIDDALAIFSKYHEVNPLPIVDNNQKLVGIISRYDIVKLFSSPGAAIAKRMTKRELDENINIFLSTFEKRFIFVSKLRTNYWLLLSVLFSIIGFIIAFALILRINAH